MKIKVNTDILPIINVDMYWSGIQSILPNDIKWEEFEKEVSIVACDKINEILCDTGFDMKVSEPKLYSPKEYNYSGDELDFVLEYNIQDIVDIYIEIINNNDFWKWIKERYSSYNGFVSFMPCNQREFILEIVTGDKQNYCICELVMWKIYIKDIDLKKKTEEMW